MIERFENWETRLHRSLLAHAATPFAWGQHDCARSVCTHLAAITGTDPAAGLRGKYSCAKTAAAAIRGYTGKGDTLEHAVEKIAADLGLKEVSVVSAHRGDVILFDTPHGQALGIVHLNGRHAILTGTEGLRRIPHLRFLQPGGEVHARRAWQVPFPNSGITSEHL